jgi:DNA-directed RNA polymerase subunit RPC12/RpoP
MIWRYTMNKKVIIILLFFFFGCIPLINGSSFSEETLNEQSVKKLKCWRCHESFEVPITQKEGTCPSCGAAYVFPKRKPPSPRIVKKRSQNKDKRTVKNSTTVTTVKIYPASPCKEDKRQPFFGLWKSFEIYPESDEINSVKIIMTWLGDAIEDSYFKLIFIRKNGDVVERGNYEVKESILYLYDTAGEVIGEGRLSEEELVMKKLAIEGIETVKLRRRDIDKKSKSKADKGLRRGLFGNIPSGKDLGSIVKYDLLINGRKYKVKLVISHLVPEEVDRIRAEMEKFIRATRFSLPTVLNFFGPESEIDDGLLTREFYASIRVEVMEAFKDSDITLEEIIKIRSNIGKKLGTRHLKGINF